MKPDDKISVLVCVHSRCTEHDLLLRRALMSLAHQTYSDFETVVVLDECWHETRGYVEGFAASEMNIAIFERDTREGLAAAKNFGISKCTGDWIAYLDADDQWMHCKLEVQRDAMLAKPSVDFCGTNAWDIVDDVLRPNCFSVTDYISHAEISKALPRENVLCHGSMMIRKTALESLGGYDTSRDFLGREDWELWCRAVANGFEFMKIPERLYIYSLGSSTAR